MQEKPATLVIFRGHETKLAIAARRGGIFRLFRKVSAFGCKEGWESGELTEELGVAFWAGKKSFDFKSGDHF